MEEGTIVDINTGEEVGSYHPWHIGEPNGGSLENCAGTWVHRKTWVDLPCSFEFYAFGFCEFVGYPTFNLRGKEEAIQISVHLCNQQMDFPKKGLCAQSDFDMKFSWNEEMVNGKYCFRGYYNSMISWNDVERNWRLENFLGDNMEIFGTTNGTDYPFGQRQWYFNKNPCNDLLQNGPR